MVGNSRNAGPHHFRRWSFTDVGFENHRRVKEKLLTLLASSLQQARHGTAIWVSIVVAGISAGLHLWKLPAALPLVQDELGFSLVFAGVLLGVFQGAGILTGLLISLIADVLGPRRILIAGMLS